MALQICFYGGTATHHTKQICSAMSNSSLTLTVDFAGVDLINFVCHPDKASDYITMILITNEKPSVAISIIFQIYSTTFII